LEIDNTLHISRILSLITIIIMHRDLSLIFLKNSITSNQYIITSIFRNIISKKILIKCTFLKKRNIKVKFKKIIIIQLIKLNIKIMITRKI